MEKIDSRWLTSTVVDLCRNIYESKDYSILPILGDALMDAGCDNQELINQCHAGFSSSLLAQRAVCLLLGGGFAAAVEEIEYIVNEIGGSTDLNYGDYTYENGKFTRNSPENDVPLSYQLIMEGAQESLEEDWNYVTQMGSENWQDEFPKYADRFWKAYEIVMGGTVNEEKKVSFFSCSC